MISARAPAPSSEPALSTGQGRKAFSPQQPIEGGHQILGRVGERAVEIIDNGWSEHRDQVQKSGSAGLRRPPILTGAMAFVRPSAPISAAMAHSVAGPNAGSKRPEGILLVNRRKRLFLVHADHRIVVAGHADVGDEAGSSGQDAVIGARRMGVRANHEARLAVDEMTERPFFARRFGVEVDDRGVAGLAERTEARARA